MKLKTSLDFKKNCMFSLIEAALITSVFILIAFYSNYSIYKKNIGIGVFSCDTNTSFDETIISDDGKEYPAGTVFNVYFITDTGLIGVKTYDNCDFWHGNYSIEETSNSVELYETLGLIKEEYKKEYMIKNIKTVGLSIVVLIASFLLCWQINSRIKEKNHFQMRLMVIITTMCLIIVSIAVIYITNI